MFTRLSDINIYNPAINTEQHERRTSKKCLICSTDRTGTENKALRAECCCSSAVGFHSSELTKNAQHSMQQIMAAAMAAPIMAAERAI